MYRLLIVDDEEQMRSLLALYLKPYGYQIDDSANGLEAYNKILQKEYDLVILDVMMPVMDGWDTLDKIRATSEVPVLMLTAKGNTEDKVIGLTSGADDYLVKPFEEAELVARIEALLRRTKKTVNENIFKYKGLSINILAREVSLDTVLLPLTQTEFDLLHVLVEGKGKVLSREQLIEQVWGIDFTGEDRTIDSHIKNLREKLKSAGMREQIIQTVWGIGYKVQ